MSYQIGRRFRPSDDCLCRQMHKTMEMPDAEQSMAIKILESFEGNPPTDMLDVRVTVTIKIEGFFKVETNPCP